LQKLAAGRVGESVIACARMHFEKATSCCCTRASCAAVGGWPKPAGSRFRHALNADLNRGERGSIPEPNWTVPCVPGSGKFDTPCERMQAENLTPGGPTSRPLATLPHPSRDVSSSRL
jgi:hypothetical protein